MKYKHATDDLRLISIGFVPALIALYIIYYLAYFLWWIPFLVVFPALAYFCGMLLEEKVMIIYYTMKKALDK
jgi:hypothetical protein